MLFGGKSLLFVSISILNFIVWLMIGRNNKLTQCNDPQQSSSSSSFRSSPTLNKAAYTKCVNLCSAIPQPPNPIISYITANKSQEFRHPLLAPYEFPDYSILINPYKDTICTKIVHQFSSVVEDGGFHDCLIVSFIKDTKNSYNDIRYNANWKLRRHLYSTTRLDTSGFFRVSGHDNGRKRMMEKIGQLVFSLYSIV